jgi:hypothetical protein
VFRSFHRVRLQVLHFALFALCRNSRVALTSRPRLSLPCVCCTTNTPITYTVPPSSVLPVIFPDCDGNPLLAADVQAHSRQVSEKQLHSWGRRVQVAEAQLRAHQKTWRGISHLMQDPHFLASSPVDKTTSSGGGFNLGVVGGGGGGGYSSAPSSPIKSV